jgi:ribosomal protein S18 acetylase RimI-like enzyme
VRASFRRPRFLWDSAGVLRSAIFAKKDPIQGEIVFIAVDQEHRGQGLGKTLVNASLDYLGKRQVPFCRTKTLENNQGVIRMYEGMGWRVRDHFRLIGRGYVTLVSPRIIG